MIPLMSNWNQIVREHLTVLRLPHEREIEIIDELAPNMKLPPKTRKVCLCHEKLIKRIEKDRFNDNQEVG